MESNHAEHLNADLGDLNAEIARIPSADGVHLDVMDNHFVPNLTFGVPMVESIRRSTAKFLDVHLMIAQADRWAPVYAEAGAESVTFHIEASDAPIKLARELRTLGARVVQPSSGHADRAPEDLLDELDMVLLMTVEPGFGGQSFLDLVLPKIRTDEAAGRARRRHLAQVDGGVSANTIERCVEAGADTLLRARPSLAPQTPTQWCAHSRLRLRLRRRLSLDNRASAPTSAGACRRVRHGAS